MISKFTKGLSFKRLLIGLTFPTICNFSLLDVDHCLDSDVCDQICVHSNGSLACECQDGYELTAGTGHCKVTGERKI